MSGRRIIAAFAPSVVTLLVTIPAVSGCAATQHLGEYDFRQKTLAVSTLAPPYPEVLSNLWVSVDRESPLRSLIRAGAEIARHVSAEEARTRLDSAAVQVDVAGRMGRRVLQGAARQLRAQPTDRANDADYELQLRIKRYGIIAHSWSAAAYYDIDADLVLLDASTGRRIWKQHLHSKEPVGARVFAGRTVTNVVTAASLAGATTGDMKRALEQLADFAADRFEQKLAEALDKVRS